MPIQFRCSGCGEPIEVDDEHAGKMAACPYCQRVVAVPQVSTFEGGPIPQARQAGAPEGAPTLPAQSQWGTAEASPREQGARKYGNFALICLLLALLSVVVMAAMSWPILMQQLQAATASQSGQITATQFSEVQAESLRALQNRPVFVSLNCVTEVLVVAALALAVTSVIRKPNTRGVVALVLSGLLIVCACAGTAVTLFKFTPS